MPKWFHSPFGQVRNGILDNKDGFEDEDNVTINTSNDSEPDFNNLDDDEFDPILGVNFDAADDFMDID